MDALEKLKSGNERYVAGGNEGSAGYVSMYVLISLSYYFLSVAAKKISIGVAYACWEGLGIALITIDEASL